MRVSNSAALVREVERRAVLLALREHPEWTLADLDAGMEASPALTKALDSVTVSALWAILDEPPVRLELARRVDGPEFDAIVHKVLVEAGEPVRAAYLRARVGGPRWKLQASLLRLVSRRLARRRGKTSDTSWQAMVKR